MEKISNIVRGSARVSSTDLKSSAPVRPGAPSYGRPVGETAPQVDRLSSTASRAVAIHNEMMENKRSSRQNEVVSQMADQFFMSRVRRPQEEDQVKLGVSPEVVAPASERVAPNGGGVDSEVEATQAPQEDMPPVGFTPRGSFVDVRA